MENMQVNLHDPQPKIEVAAELEPEEKKVENEDGIVAKSSKGRRKDEGPTGSCSDPSALSQSTGSQGSAPKSSKHLLDLMKRLTTEPNVIEDGISSSVSSELALFDDVQLERNVFKVRPRASAVQTNPEVDEEIAEEDAVCIFCFVAFGEEDIFKTKCGCTKAFAHENCAALSGNNCGYCGQEIENLPVTLIRGLSSAQGVDRREQQQERVWTIEQGSEARFLNFIKEHLLVGCPIGKEPLMKDRFNLISVLF